VKYQGHWHLQAPNTHRRNTLRRMTKEKEKCSD